VATRNSSASRPVFAPTLPAAPPRNRFRGFVDREIGRCVLLSLFCGFLFFYGLRPGELWRTESLRAIIAAEFLRSGNWVVPMLYGEPLFTKPPGMYAAIAAVSAPFGGVTELTARLPSALAATATVFLFYFFLRRTFGGRLALAAALILPTSLMWLDKASTAEIDMSQVFWVAAALVCFLRAVESEELSSTKPVDAVRAYRVGWNGRAVQTLEEPLVHPAPAPEVGQVLHRFQKQVSPEPSSIRAPSWWGTAGWWWLAALLCVAGGVLTKWTAPAFFYATAITFLWARGRLLSLFSRRHLLSAAIAGSICLVWIGLAARQGGWPLLRDTVSQEALMRLSPQHHHRAYPWLETLVHPFKLLASTLPWSFFALFTLHPKFMRLWDARGRFLLQAFHAWTWPSLLFWSVIPEHSPRHSFPLFPGIAGLAALFMIAWIRGRLPFRTTLRPWPVLIGLVVAWLGVKVVFVEGVMPHRNRDRLPRSKGELLANIVPPGETLYLFRLKDEGIMFYYGRPVRRLHNTSELPLHTEPVYCILDKEERDSLATDERIQVLQNLRDEQGAAIALVRIEGPPREPH
jgi:4-amino-4-deoxy-L-arabinose transferase-like glycosyltransferase